MNIRYFYIVLFCLALILSGCVSLASNVLEQLQPTPEPTVPPVATRADDQNAEATPLPTAIGGVGDAPLLFISNRSKDGATDMYQINPDGSGLGRLTDDPAIESHPRWSPDRSRIAFVSNHTGLDQIYLMSATDYQLTQLTDLPSGATGLTWSPDSTQIAFVETEPESGAILIVDTETGAEVSRHPVQLQGLANLAWSPLGQLIVFSALVEGQDDIRDIFSLNLRDDMLINLTLRAGDDDRPAWSPNGRQIAFQTDRDGDFDIFIMQANGALQTPLTLNFADDLDPHWSADSSLIAFSSNRDGQYNLYIMSANGSDAHVLAPFAANDSQPNWPPLLQTVVDQLIFAGGIFEDAHNLFFVSAAGSAEIQLTRTTADDTTPAWSPDGDKIVFASNREGNYELYLLNLDEKDEPRRLTESEGPDLHPDWSPDGKQIAFESIGESGNWDVWVIDADGSNLQNLTNTPDADDGNPAWSPDGQHLVFSSNRAGTFDLYLLSADGAENVERLTSSDGNEVYPSWSPDGQAIVFRAESESDGNHQLFIMTRDGQSVRPLFKSQYNDDLPVWSPDGRRIAFASDRVSSDSQLGIGNYTIFIYNLRTGILERVTQGTRDASYPAWRPRSSRQTP